MPVRALNRARTPLLTANASWVSRVTVVGAKLAGGGEVTLPGFAAGGEDPVEHAARRARAAAPAMTAADRGTRPIRYLRWHYPDQVRGSVAARHPLSPPVR